MPSELRLRAAEPQDADAVAQLYLEARAAAYPAVPRSVHPADDVHRWWHSRVRSVEPGTEVWVAEQGQAPVGLLLLEDSWLHSLYVAPALAGQGIGSALLDLAKSLRPDGLGLWVFESNLGAQRFYARHGFGVVRRCDGTGPGGNEEGRPDLEMAWPDPTSLAGMRQRVDAVDDRLAATLEERAVLTARIQHLKDVPGHAGRDVEREAQIAVRMARLAPRLGRHRLARIMHEVITQSLDAVENETTTESRQGER